MSTVLIRPQPFGLGFQDFPDVDDYFDRETAPREQPRTLARAEGIGIVVTGDNHLSPALPRLAPERRAQRRERLRAAFQSAVTYAIERGARLFLHVGDLFDSPTPSNADRAHVAACLAQLQRAGVTSVAIGGNHDTPRLRTEAAALAPQQVYAALGALHYFPAHDALCPHLVEIDGLRIALMGLSNDPTAAPGSDPLAGVPIRDPEGVLAQAQTGILLLHAGVEGLCRPTEGERIVAQRSIQALPPRVRTVVAGHIHRYARTTLDARTVVVCGATERMEFGGAAGHAGFAWLDLGPEGVLRAEHIPIEEQPRAEILLSTSSLWPGAVPMPHRPTPADAQEHLPVADALPHAADAPYAALTPIARIHRSLAEVCTPQTMVRLRLAGPLTRAQYQQLVLREVLLYAEQHAFSLEVDTRDLLLVEEATLVLPAPAAEGPLTPLREVEALLRERLARAPTLSAAEEAELRAAADLLLDRLRGALDGEGAP